MKPVSNNTPGQLAERKRRYELYFQLNKMLAAEIEAHFEDRQRAKKTHQVDQIDLFK